MYRCYTQGIGRYSILDKPTLSLQERIGILRIIFFELFPSFLVVCEFYFPAENKTHTISHLKTVNQLFVLPCGP